MGSLDISISVTPDPKDITTVFPVRQGRHREPTGAKRCKGHPRVYLLGPWPLWGHRTNHLFKSSGVLSVNMQYIFHLQLPLPIHGLPFCITLPAWMQPICTILERMYFIFCIEYSRRTYCISGNFSEAIIIAILASKAIAVNSST